MILPQTELTRYLAHRIVKNTSAYCPKCYGHNLEGITDKKAANFGLVFYNDPEVQATETGIDYVCTDCGCRWSETIKIEIQD